MAETKCNYFYIFSFDSSFKAVNCGNHISIEPFIHEERMTRDYSIYIVNEGKLALEQNDIYSLGEANDIITHTPFVKEKGFEAHKVNYYWYHFIYHEKPLCLSQKEIEEKLELDSNYLVDKVILPIHQNIPNIRRLRIYTYLMLEAFSDHNNNQALLDSYMRTFCLEISNQFISKIVRKENKYPATVQMIIDYVNRNIEDSVSVSDVALKFGYNQKYLSHLFKETLGITLKEYLENIRMDKIDSYLINTNYSINKIANLFRYSDSHYLRKKYKKIRGYSISTIRKKKI